MTDRAFEAKKILSGYNKKQRRIREQRLRIREIRENATNTVSQIDGIRVSGTKSQSKIENAINNALDLEMKLEQTIDRLQREQAIVECALDDVPDMDAERLLHYRYIDGLKWDAVMAKMMISRTTSYRICVKGLELFYDEYKRRRGNAVHDSAESGNKEKLSENHH